ncbi:VOC family protein [Chondromyces crocatus]|uniref:VOC domain-containing protein n=1 Tax=Chondromyces crocatus TaxID=52 RepID=A0A0K1EL68_CHOCO|nr:VOC family protein [Chondromyces crocatus]AKT41358.1 uncharacterized protein CMC5_055580 [Chondromyces crocatus]
MSASTSPGVLSHGTLEVRNVDESVRFYRDFLGMKVIYDVPKACVIWLHESWYIVCVENPNAREMPMLNHFGIDVESREAVDQWYERAVRERDLHGISTITRPKVLHEAYQFYLRDRDHNWWEFQHDTTTFARMRAMAVATQA